jgi:uncharacterized phiE125 gp8 family phage protein
MIRQNTEKVAILKDEIISKDKLETYLNFTIIDDREHDMLKLVSSAAIEYVEKLTRRAIAKSRFQSVLSSFPDTPREGIYLPHPPLQSIESLTYVDSNGVTQNLTDYQLDRNQKRTMLFPSIGEVWPTLEVGNRSPIIVTYIAGYVDHSTIRLPPLLETAIYQTIDTFWQNRGSVVEGLIMNVPNHLTSVLTSFRLPVRESYDGQSKRVQSTRGVAYWQTDFPIR